MEYLFSYLLIVMNFQISLQNNFRFMQTVSGEVHKGNFSYYTLMVSGLLSLELISHSGDSDLYISQFNSNPTFEPSSYCLQSSTCGLDVVVVPKRFKRPISVGIYGHPSHEISIYTLNIYKIPEFDENGYEISELSVSGAPVNITDEDMSVKENSEENSILWMVFYKLLVSVLEVLLSI